MLAHGGYEGAKRGLRVPRRQRHAVHRCRRRGHAPDQQPLRRRARAGPRGVAAAAARARHAARRGLPQGAGHSRPRRRSQAPHPRLSLERGLAAFERAARSRRRRPPGVTLRAHGQRETLALSRSGRRAAPGAAGRHDAPRRRRAGAGAALARSRGASSAPRPAPPRAPRPRIPAPLTLGRPPPPQSRRDTRSAWASVQLHAPARRVRAARGAALGPPARPRARHAVVRHAVRGRCEAHARMRRSWARAPGCRAGSMRAPTGRGRARARVWRALRRPGRRRVEPEARCPSAPRAGTRRWAGAAAAARWNAGAEWTRFASHPRDLIAYAAGAIAHGARGQLLPRRDPRRGVRGARLVARA